MGGPTPAGATRLFLVRHGETEPGRPGIIAGRLDLPLSARGLEQARAAAAALPPLAAVYASPLRRALETAWIVAAPRGLAPVPDPDLRELDFGALEGLTFDEAAARHPTVAAAWLERPHEVLFPGGECLEALRSRVVRAVDRIVARHASAAVAVVCHAGPIRALVADALGLAPRRTFEVGCAHGSVHLLEAEGRWRAPRPGPAVCPPG
jgi:broad specificity phosphatase PhoE